MTQKYDFSLVDETSYFLCGRVFRTFLQLFSITLNKEIITLNFTNGYFESNLYSSEING